MKKKTIIIAIISFALGALIYNLFSPIFLQEQNTWALVKGVTSLTVGKENMVKLSDSDNTYLTKGRNGREVIDGFLKRKGYEFEEQMGSGYFYTSLSNNAVLTRRQYSKFYLIWTITEHKNKSIAEELKECLPRSDTASHEKCSRLLKQITDFDSCVSAGFSIMKSNPPQCVMPDGQIFLEVKK